MNNQHILLPKGITRYMIYRLDWPTVPLTAEMISGLWQRGQCCHFCISISCSSIR